MSSSSRRRRRGSAPMGEIQGPVRSTRQRLLELDAPPADDRSSASSAETVDQTCREGDIPQGAPKTGQGLSELDKLPEDMLQHIHSLVPLQDAARAACVSRRFLCSWRCYSNLKLSRETLGLTDYTSEGSEIYINKIDQIINNYSGNEMKVKKLTISLLWCKSVSASYLDRWLQIAVKSGINELSLWLPCAMEEKYRFPYSVLFDGTANSSIQSLYLFKCIFEPMETLGCFGNLKTICLYSVNITEEGLRQFLSSSSSLEKLQIYSCGDIVCLKIPCKLVKLKFIIVEMCHKIQAVEINAPNLFSFRYTGLPIEISIRDPCQLKKVFLSSSDPSRIISYGRAKLPSIAPNVERLTLTSHGENVNTPMLLGKLLFLKSLEIRLRRSGGSPTYDIFSVVSFLDASPALESFLLHAERDAIIRDCVAGDDIYLRGESVYQYHRLRHVKITGFHSAKSLIKLVIHILERAPLLEALTLDTTHGCGRKPGDISGCTASRGLKCPFMEERDIEDANSAVEAVGRYIVGRVPSAVEFEVLEPCRRCHMFWQPAGR